MDRTACTELQCLYKGDLYLLPFIIQYSVIRIRNNEFYKNPSSGCRAVPRGQTDGNDEANSRFYDIFWPCRRTTGDSWSERNFMWLYIYVVKNDSTRACLSSGCSDRSVLPCELCNSLLLYTNNMFRPERAIIGRQNVFLYSKFYIYFYICVCDSCV